MVIRRLGCKCSGFHMGSEIRKLSPLKSWQMAAILSENIWNLDKNVRFPFENWTNWNRTFKKSGFQIFGKNFATAMFPKQVLARKSLVLEPIPKKTICVSVERTITIFDCGQQSLKQLSIHPPHKYLRYDVFGLWPHNLTYLSVDSFVTQPNLN